MARPEKTSSKGEEAERGPNAPGMLLEDFSERVRANSDLMTKMSAVVARAGQVMAARQAQAMSEAIDDLTKLMRETLSETGDPAAISRAHAAYAEAVFRRAVLNLKLSLESLAELSASALELSAHEDEGDASRDRK